MNSLPSGTVTFLFTDIEGSTKLAQQYPDAMPTLLARHHEILHQSIQAHNGYVFQVVGDSWQSFILKLMKMNLHASWKKGIQ
ncbi:MAG: hypothetical protein M3R47_07655 [Chloroflexota bacterium]|nr:hypothetical protein [Chloroflexota bacterium]